MLAEGEKAALMVVAATDDQGVYGLVANLGSLFVRVVLAPFEESAFHAFSRAQVLSMFGCICARPPSALHGRLTSRRSARSHGLPFPTV